MRPKRCQKISSASLTVLAMMTAFLLSGCRLGNNVEEANPKAESGLSGLYDATVSKVTLYATVNGNTIYQEVDPQFTPNWIKQYISNPVRFEVLDPDDQLAGLMNSANPTSALPIYYQENGDLGYQGRSKSLPFWKDPRCESRIEITESGYLESIPTESTDKDAVSGKLHLDVQVLSIFQGVCQPTFTAVSDCYHSASQCGEVDPDLNQESHEAVLWTFSPWVESGFLTISDLKKLSNYAYEVSYE